MSHPEVITLTVAGMHCASCGLLVDDALEQLPGVVRADTDSRAGHTIVHADLTRTSVEEMIVAVDHVGYRAKAEVH